MKNIVVISQPINKILIELASTSNEIYLATSLVKQSGLKWLKQSGIEKRNVKLNALIGIALPSGPTAIRKVMLAAINTAGAAKIYRGVFFHPKVYLFRKKRTFTAIVGSSNLTSGGLETNIETNLLITNQNICRQLLHDFDTWNETAIPLTADFIKNYAKSFKKRQALADHDNKIANSITRKIAHEAYMKVRNWKKLITSAKNFKMKKDYHMKKRDRLNGIRKIKNSLDYPRFSRIDLDSFYKIYDLGHIVAVNKPVLKRNLKKLVVNLRFLVDETIPIEQRINALMSGTRHQRGLGINIITKILTAVYPKKYGVQNKLSIGVLRQYGLGVTRGIGDGKRYRLLCELLNKIADESGLDDLSMVDLFFTEKWYAK